MTDDLDAQMAAALRALEREPASSSRAAVARRVSRRRLRRSGVTLLAVAATAGLALAIARTSDSPPVVALGNNTSTSVGRPTPVGSQPPPPAASDARILTFPTTVAGGDDLAAVLHNRSVAATVTCFRTVHLERWNGDRWLAVSDLLAKGADPNSSGPSADCARDLLLPGTFLGERTFTIPSDVEPGYYRLIDQATEGEGRITVVQAGSEPTDEPRPVGNERIDLSQGADLADGAKAAIARAVVLDDNRLAISWDSSCNAPGRRIDFDYEPDRVTAHLAVGTFFVIDCVGSPTMWSTVVDLPAPLWGRDVVVDSGGRELTAERVDVAPISTFLLSDMSRWSTDPPIVATSIFHQQRTPVSIQLDVFGAACIADALSVVLRSETGEVFVEPHVQVQSRHEPGDVCANGPGWTRIEPHVFVPAGATFFGPVW